MRPEWVRGLCRSHYDKYWYAGKTPPKPKQSGRTTPSKYTRFLNDLLERNPGYDCVNWPFTVRRGYGVYRGQGVHRIVCERAHGSPPDGYVAAHYCGNPSCVNPRHLRWATPKENSADTVMHAALGNGPRGNGRLTAQNVWEIQASSETTTVLGKRFGVTRRTIRNAKKGESYANLA